ncbi:hypothetical protein BDF20DRAFT_875542 [Mycotypha africana]|uniref:uncharacterized protein n=1 Tax=Mycotypha africana TaxID=64632 RepID=UPI0023019CDB|nr:uncharacterized protein BDF20DRAFT_875542 [Mycotypha africana]KAI8977564.1 hypothetical protein BDF20DRAFT_875542 [Mycotypha africana]
MDYVHFEYAAVLAEIDKSVDHMETDDLAIQYGELGRNTRRGSSYSTNDVDMSEITSNVVRQLNDESFNADEEFNNETRSKLTVEFQEIKISTKTYKNYGPDQMKCFIYLIQEEGMPYYMKQESNYLRDTPKLRRLLYPAYIRTLEKNAASL